MTQQATMGTGADQAPSGDAALDSRANSMFSRLAAESRAEQVESDEASDEVAELTTETPTTPPPRLARKDAAPPADEDEKLSRLAALERENARQRQTASKAEREARDRLQKAEAREKELVEREKVFNDPETALDFIEKHIGPEKLIEWLQSQSDPVKRATNAAERSAKKDLSPLEERIKALEAENEGHRNAKAQQAAVANFTARVNEVATEAPLVARAFTKKPERMVARANAIALRMSQGDKDWNFDDVIIELEQDLQDERSIFSDDAAEQASASPRTDTNSTQATAAAKAKTLTNRHGSARTTLDEGNTASKMSMTEKIRATERKARRLT